MVLAVHAGASAAEIGELVHAHPSFSEPVMEAAADALGVAIHK
jgi:dihydrolipoamide dehydrogenase